MKILSFIRSFSRSVHEEHQGTKYFKADQQEVLECASSLTVWRKSLLLSCNGFTVINSNGNLVYRVDDYIHRRRSRPDELILMDGFGKSLLTMHRSKLRLADNWVVYEGEASKSSSNEPIFYVRKHINILHGNPITSVLAYVYEGKRRAYRIEGSYHNRSCKVFDDSRRVVVEIKRKDNIIGGIPFEKDVFVLEVMPGFDPGFAMALVLLLDQMFS
ncbi:putative UPF0706 protein [Tripterygium wilfordii]|uniref:Putative UPF0706 protein n=1 Tax=Tripterygium wilfordii TaxID=458696 RepID=A0A7J7CL53_TRIWF|nr:protein LURP-one-related 17 [Tripterygium wilfordii]KAF5734793.1 putative UPF0706 protein [Tripterygium wilfordii]